MVGLKWFDQSMIIVIGLNTPHSSHGCCEGGDVRNLMLDCRFADIEIIVFAQLPAWCIYHQLDLTVLNGIYDVRPAFV